MATTWVVINPRTAAEFECEAEHEQDAYQKARDASFIQVLPTGRPLPPRAFVIRKKLPD